MVVSPVLSVLTKLNTSSDSSQIKPTFCDVPLSIMKPESTLGMPSVPDESIINGSLTSTFVVLIVVVVPFTLRFPLIVILPDALISLALSSPEFIVPVVLNMVSAKSIPVASDDVIDEPAIERLPKLEADEVKLVVSSVVDVNLPFAS